MMRFIQPRSILVGTAFMLTLIACNANESAKTAAPANNANAAMVNGVPISESRVAMFAAKRAAQGQPDSAESRKMIIDYLSTQMLLAQEAFKKGLDKSPEALEQIDLARQSILTNAFVQDYFATAAVSDEALHAEYDKIKVQMAGTEYKARHILVEKEADAKAIIAKLKKDVKAFDALAKEKSKDTGSKDRGGDLGWFDPRVMVPEFGAAVAKLEKGKFTEEPVKSQYGYHVILLEDSREKQPPAFEQVKGSLKHQVQQENLKKLIDDIKAKAKIEIIQAPAAVATPAAAPEAKPTEADKKK
jgi:peptidyl-prolyl cis-trans isomerase C